MILEKERNEIVDYCKRLITSGLTKGTGGNISIYVKDQRLMAISPSSIDYFKLTAEDIVVMDLDGNIVSGERRPSTEYDMHRIFYLKREDISAVVHAHSIYATVLSCLNLGIEPTHYLIGFAGKNVRCGKYETYGTWELAEEAFKAMEDRYAAILGNHGLIAGGETISQAFTTCEQVEFVAEVYYKALLVKNPVILTDSQMEVVLDKFGTYGKKDI